ncbi:MAG: four helix bundle protein [Balneola sp.]|nr:four helix bundle protein [Balneola sp.]MBO6649980.1 four helix bundle protein [Balneola sp.]MBO6711670.1 four helix bundle protein [Balneola sp.]MBO6799866.1 four helix bundle protein [Balneola sp.]MBO6871109.1 four helix bundle protein [Balneola sp.]
MNYSDWEETVFFEITADIPWKIEAYRLSLFLADLAWNDCSIITENHKFSLSDQLYRSAGSISANIVEGYSRISNKEKARFYEIALGSTREARDWYYKSRHLFTSETIRSRIKLLTSIIKLLQVMITDRRKASRI